MYKLYDAGSGEVIGTLNDQQLRFLIDHLEEESAADRDYYINTVTLDMFAANGADTDLLSMLRDALGNRQDMDIRWDTTASQ